MRSTGFRLAICLLIPGAIASHEPGHATAVPAQAGREAAQIAELATGDQLVITDYSGSLEFAGRTLELEGFSGILGYSSQAAYAIAVDGSARIGEVEATRGRMLLVAPFGEGIITERFDARRLHQAFSEDPQAGRIAPLLTSLEGLADRQDLGVFFGRLSRTRFNVTTMGSAKAERARRARIGGRALREVRYSSPQSVGDSERRIIEGFAEALARGDAVEVGQFLDPLPYGTGAAGGDAAGARRLAAEALLAQADWGDFAGVEPERTGDTSWRIVGKGVAAAIELRRTTDFAFVTSIEVGE